MRTSTSHEEGCEREWSVLTKAFIGDENGNLKAVQLVEIEWAKDEKTGRYGFQEIVGTMEEIPCELALLAVGFLHPQHEGLLKQLGVTLDSRGNVYTSENSYQTNKPKVFAAGDMRRGQSLVVWAISEGREAARQVDEYLMGHSLLESKEKPMLSLEYVG